MLQQQNNNQQQLVQQLSNKNVLNNDQSNYFTPEIRKLIEKQQQPNPQIQNYQQNNQPQFNNRQNDFQNQNQSFNPGQQITYTSTPGSAFVSPVLPFNQQLNVQQNLPLGNIRQFSNNQPNNFPKREHNRNRNLDNKDRDDFHKRDHNRDRNRNLDRNLDRKDDQRHNRDDRSHDKTRDDRFRDHRDNREKDRKNQARSRNTESPSNSVTSSNTNNTNKPRRRYTPLNIPTYEILKSPINTYDIKRKFDSTIHIPSDFKELQINEKYELNFQCLHKPIQYRIVHDEKKEDNDKKDEKSETPNKNDVKKESTSKDNSVTEEKTDETKETDKPKDKSSDKSSDTTSIKQEEKDDFKDEKSKKKQLVISHKYAVKVLLLSFPSMNNIYDRVIENDRDKDSYTSSSKAYFLHFNKVFSYLCLKKENDGHALIGGKFDPKLDGYLNENKPNLIQTAIRCVKQQTGIDLSPCKKWKHMCTFIYNRDDSPFYDNVSFEYSKIFIPDIWSLLERGPLASSLSIKNEELNSLDSSKNDCTNDNETSFNSVQVNASNVIDDLSSMNESKLENNEMPVDQANESAETNFEIDPASISQLNELKVTELRSRLEELGHKPAKSLKKVDLIAKLADILRSNMQKAHELKKEEVKAKEIENQETEVNNENNLKDESISNKKEENEIQENMETSDNQLSESITNEVKKEPDENSNKTEATKRKADEEASDEASAKKVKKESGDCKEVDNKELEAISKDGFIMAYGSSSITVLNLYQALNHNKYDHFELQIVSELLKEALIGHFSNYILSTCYENRHLLKDLQDDKKEENLKDAPENNYVLLAFSYFDSCHCGYLIADDLQKILSCSGINFSKRTWTYIFGSNDKIRYRFFKEPTKIYNFNQIKQNNLSNQSSTEVKGTLYEKDGNVYDIDKLITQSNNDEKLKAELEDKLRLAEESIKNLQSNLSDQEAKQKKMTIAFKKQNEEVCDYKRDKEKIKYKV